MNNKDTVQDPGGVPVWKIFLAFLGLIVFLGLFVWLNTITADPQSPNTVDEAPIGTPIGAAIIGMGVQELPTQTSAPSKTPWPSATATETRSTPNPMVVYVEITQVVEVVIERVITATPAPWTPSVTPEPSATALPLWLIQANHDAEMSRRREQITIRLAEFFLSPASLITILVFLIVIFGVIIAIRWSNMKIDDAGGHETKEDIEQRSANEVEVNLIDMLTLLRESERRYGAGERRLAGWREMVEIDVHWTAEHWSTVVGDLESLGLRTIRQSGVGTFLANNTIRAARLMVMRLGQTPSPTARSHV